MRASKTMYNSTETYKKVTFDMIFINGYPRRNIFCRQNYGYFSVNLPGTKFDGRIRVYRGAFYFHVEVKVGNKWVTWNEYDWEV